MTTTTDLPVVDRLLKSEHPALKYKTRTRVLGEEEQSKPVLALRREIRGSVIIRKLLSGRGADGTIPTHAYRKWQGPHWTLAALAALGYPPGDRSLAPLRDPMYAWLFEPAHLEFRRSLAIPGQAERFRRCASQEGNAVWYSLVLGLEDDRTEELARRLREWQWPDGGWNCDKKPSARISSVMETLIPLRALALHARLRRNADSRRAVDRAAEFLLSRKLLWRIRDGRPMNPVFLQIEYPHRVFDLLLALVVMAESGYIRDERCSQALDLLQSKQLPDGGFPAERRTYTVARRIVTRGDYVDWGPHGRRRTNLWATAEALYVLRAAGRWKP